MPELKIKRANIAWNDFQAGPYDLYVNNKKVGEIFSSNDLIQSFAIPSGDLSIQLKMWPLMHSQKIRIIAKPEEVFFLQLIPIIKD